MVCSLITCKQVQKPPTSPPPRRQKETPLLAPHKKAASAREEPSSVVGKAPSEQYASEAFDAPSSPVAQRQLDAVGALVASPSQAESSRAVDSIVHKVQAQPNATDLAPSNQISSAHVAPQAHGANPAPVTAQKQRLTWKNQATPPPVPEPVPEPEPNPNVGSGGGVISSASVNPVWH